jgi:sulfate adenylyltransferase
MTLTSQPRNSNGRSGAAILITGLPASGKTTLARSLAAAIEAEFSRHVTLLDGDEVRRLLSSELGFSRDHRRLNVLRHGYVAAEVCRHGGIAVCALIAPYVADRADMRNMAAHHGHFIEIYLSTSLAECERRDPKGLYARARAGRLPNMTGVDDPYEAPQNPELQFDGQLFSVNDMTRRTIDYLERRSVLAK